MRIEIDPSPSCAPFQAAGSQRGATPQPASCEEALALRQAAQTVWAELQAVPSYVEVQARTFLEECEALFIEVEGKGEQLSKRTHDSTNVHHVVIL